MSESRPPLTFDWMLFILILVLSGLGLVMLLSASSIMAEQKFGDAYFFCQLQIRNILIGLVVMLVLARVPYQFWQKFAYPVLIACFILLVVVLVPGIGYKVGDTYRWIRLPGMSIQPSELVKLGLVLYLAYSLSRKGEKSGSFLYGFLPHLIFLSLTVGLVLLGRDLGIAACVIGIAFTMMFVAGTKIWHMVMLGVAALPLLYYQIINHPYRLQRITTFLDPWADPQDGGFQIIHSFYAFASGGLWGQGPGASQQKLFFLPEPHTDFIFSVLAEEFGLVGVAVVGIIFIILIIRGLNIAKSAPDYFGVYLALGCTLIVGMPAFLNMCVVTALLPTKGLPLPFFSYGGTNMLVCFASMGLLMNVAGQSRGFRPQPSTARSGLARALRLPRPGAA